MASHRKKEMDGLIDQAKCQGWRVELRDAGHYAFYAPDGETIIFAGSTPSDYRAVANLRSRLRREGVRV